jgi:hypothetical protein
MEDMCTRTEVHDEIDRAVGKLRLDLAEQRDERIREIAKATMNEEQEKLWRWIGFGGIAAAVTFVYFFGGLTNDVEHLQNEILTANSSLSEIEDFMNRGDRFTIDDGNDLKQYVDQQDQYTIRVIEQGIQSINNRLDRLDDNNK